MLSLANWQSRLKGAHNASATHDPSYSMADRSFRRISPGRGGRPRNNWNSSRRRKLVRLFTLTNLEQDEIQKVLVASNFNPSSSDMQKKLRALLGKEYAKRSRKFRPSDETDMSRRFEKLRKCKEGRIRKRQFFTHRSGGCHLPTRGIGSDDDRLRCASDWCFGLPSAFRDYSSSLSPWSYNQSFFKDSELLDSSLLLLDGSVLQTTNETDTSSAKLEERPSTPISIGSLDARLSNKYSLTNLEHISAVLQSSNNSWESSLMSVTDSWRSRISPNRQATRHTSSKIVAAPRDFFRYKIRTLPDVEQRIWDDVIDDTQVDPGLSPRPPYQGISLTSRPCCDLASSEDDANILCTLCGFSKAHYLVRTYGDQAILSGEVSVNHINKRDYFENIPLHYVAASGHATLSTITTLLSLGAAPHHRNTSGQTFLHLLLYNNFECFRKYTDLLRLLAARSFSFHQRDYHGRTVAHILCEDPEVEKLSVENLGEIFQILTPDLHALDNRGNSVRQRLSQWAAKSLSEGQLERHQGLTTLLEQYNKPIRLQVDFRTVLSSMSCDDKVRRRWVQSTNNVTWIDVKGDTPLTAVLKDWNSEDDELKLRLLVKELVQSGAEIHTRDRNGYCALTIAAIRGFRSIVAFLLTNGAHYHARDYDGAGILEQATVALKIARYKQKDKLYSMIFCCITLLTDFGAKEDPNEIEEWMSPPPMSVPNSRVW